MEYIGVVSKDDLLKLYCKIVSLKEEIALYKSVGANPFLKKEELKRLEKRFKYECSKIKDEIVTSQEKLTFVETVIRKTLPRLMELSEGVILKRKETSELYSDYVILKIKREDYSTYVEIDGKHNGSFFINNDELLDCFEIIGHEVLLSDALAWLSINIDNFNLENIRFMRLFCETYRIEKEQKVSRDGKRKVKEWTGTHMPYINLSKPHLADQGEEFINFLYNLIVQ